MNVLGLAEVGLDDPVPGFGGNSLEAARIIARVLPEFRVNLPTAALYEASTVGAMAALIASHQSQQLDASRLEELLHKLELLPEAEAVQLLALNNAG